MWVQYEGMICMDNVRIKISWVRPCSGGFSKLRQSLDIYMSYRFSASGFPGSTTAPELHSFTGSTCLRPGNILLQCLRKLMTWLQQPSPCRVDTSCLLEQRAVLTTRGCLIVTMLSEGSSSPSLCTGSDFIGCDLVRLLVWFWGPWLP